MGREIRFKALRVTGSGFMLGYLVIDKVTRKHYITTDHVYSNSIDVCCANCYEVIPESVGQFTGLKDKCGVHIYEGDIVRATSFNPSAYLIEFIEGGFCCTHKDIKKYPTDINHFYDSTGCAIEVIGNIHQNQHLLK